MKFCLAVCIALLFFSTASHDIFLSKASNLVFNATGKFWFPQKQVGLIFFSEFFAATVHDKANSRSQSTSSTVHLQHNLEKGYILR